jgi:hypothetical protein
VDEPIVPNVDVRDTYSLVQSGSQRRVDVARFVHLVLAETQLIVLQVPIDEIIALSNAIGGRGGDGQCTNCRSCMMRLGSSAA